MEKNGNDMKYIIADDGLLWIYDYKNFVTIEEWRELQPQSESLTQERCCSECVKKKVKANARDRADN